MPRARLSIKSNEGLIALSESHPDSRFTVLGAWPRDDCLRTLVETGDLSATSLVATIEDSSLLDNLDVHYEGIEQVRFEVDIPKPAAHGAMTDSGTVPPFPLTLEGGWLTGEFATSRSQLAAFRAELEAGDIPYNVTLVETRVSESESLLTERQREVVLMAISEGYYNYPRKCTLTDLAATLGVDKSVISRILQRAESQLIQAQFE